jgi:hypothetical protein
MSNVVCVYSTACVEFKELRRQLKVTDQMIKCFRGMVTMSEHWIVDVAFSELILEQIGCQVFLDIGNQLFNRHC